ncbi:hypothetical protein Haur_1398 [Herpetosiphon aurantiacus DSM 785]|uniref:Uncharacterized protein n=2 Tax=Herpetosiphon TaxID=64 RepID=A9B2J8_HERA2|nr:hypothetical protein Haur_1398 [Herpetosiphon aurantiacus DSM 785]
MVFFTMRQLSNKIKQHSEVEGSLRALSIKSGVSYTGLKNLRDNPDVTPDLETLVKFAKTFKLPFWRIIEMAGFDLEFSETSTIQAQRLISVMDAMPEYQSVVEHLLELDSYEVNSVLIYLETLKNHRK